MKGFKLKRYHVDLILISIVLVMAIFIIYSMTKENNLKNLLDKDKIINKLNNNEIVNKVVNESINFVVNTNNANNLDIKKEHFNSKKKIYLFKSIFCEKSKILEELLYKNKDITNRYSIIIIDTNYNHNAEHIYFIKKFNISFLPSIVIEGKAPLAPDMNMSKDQIYNNIIEYLYK